MQNQSTQKRYSDTAPAIYQSNNVNSKKYANYNQTENGLLFFYLIILNRARSLNFFCFYLAVLAFSFSNNIAIARVYSPPPVVIAGPYTVNFTGVTYNSNNTTTFSYNVQRTGSSQGNGLSHLIFGLGTCATFNDVTSATIDGNSYSNLAGSEGNGTGCAISSAILKFDNLPSSPSNGLVHTFTFTLAGTLEVINNTTWVKAGNSCYQASILGPGCPKQCNLELNLNKSDITCFGNNNGSITATATGGTGTLEYSSNGQDYQSNNVFSNLGKGEHTIYAREKDYKTCAVSKTIVINQPIELAFSTSYLPIKCYNDKTIVAIAATGGTANYQYSVNGGASYQFNNEFELAAGTYQICVKDKNNCIIRKTLIIDQPVAITFTPTYSPINCYNDKTVLTIEANGGTGTLLYSINNGLSYQNTNTFTNIAAGEYKVIVKDANDCIQHSNLTIQQPELLTVTTTSTPIACYGDKTTISVTAAGGNGSYQYALDGTNYQISNIFENIDPGEHLVYVKDANACIQSKTITVIAPESIKINTSFTSIQCNGDKTTLLVTASGGTGNLTYSVSGGTSYQSSNQFGDLLAGTYNVYVKDQNGCIQQKQVVIEQPTKLEFTVTSIPITCFGDKSTLTVIASGGTAPFNYSINGGSSYQGSNEFTNLPAGEYTVFVKDNNDCVQHQQVTITAPTKVVVTTSFEPIECYAGTTAITVTANGGTGSFTYAINNGSYSSNNTFNNLIAGEYTVWVKDENGCFTGEKVVVIQPQEISVTTFYSAIKCYDGTTNLTVSVTGGTAPFQYSINGGISYQGSDMFENLAPGNYNVLVKDAMDCVKSKQFAITAPDQIVITPGFSPIKCYSGNTTVTITATGGTGTYMYALDGDNYQTSNVFENIGSGEHRIYVKDANACIQSKAITITQPEQLIATLTFIPITCYGSKTLLTVNVTGGTDALEYALNNGTYSSANTFNNLIAGEYTVHVRDNNGCIISKTVTIKHLAPISIMPAFDPIKCNGDKTTLLINANGGAGDFTYSINGGTSYQSSNAFSNLPGGTYTVCAKDKNGCVQCQQIVMEQPNKLEVATTYLPIVCRGGKTTLTVAATGGTAPFSYSINGGTSYQNSNIFTNLSSADYKVCVKDKNGCITCITICIVQPAAMILKTAYLPIKCYSDKTTLTITGSGGTGALVYSVNGSTYQNSNVFQNLPAGNYKVYMRDANGCSKSVAVCIVQPKAIVVNTSYPAIKCYGDKTTLTVTASSGTAPYQYALNNGTYQASNVFKYLSAGTYTVCVKDSKGCVQCKQVCIVAPKPIVITTTYPAILCYGGKTTLTVQARGGTGSLLYAINGGTYQSNGVFRNLSAGSYTVAVKDANGCVLRQSVNIVQPKAITTAAARIAVSPEQAVLTEDHFTIYPNPYLTKANIEFTLMKSSTYTLMVYDVTGSEVKRLSTGKAEAGQLYHFELDGLPTGVYIVTLITDNFKKTFKISHN